MGKGERSAEDGRTHRRSKKCRGCLRGSIQYGNRVPDSLCVFDRELEPLQGRGYSPDESAEPVFEELFKDSKEE